MRGLLIVACLAIGSLSLAIPIAVADETAAGKVIEVYRSPG